MSSVPLGMRKVLLVSILFLVSCNKDKEDDVGPPPDITGNWEHLYFFFEDIIITEDSIFTNFSAAESYEQLNDSILIIDNGSRQRTVNYRRFNNGTLYYSLARSFNNKPLKFGRDSVIYEMYEK